MSSLKQTFGDRLREARKAKGFSRAHLAELLSSTEGASEPSGQQRIANYELGYNEPGWTTMRHLADILGVSMDWLGGREPGGLDARFEQLRKIYHRTDERGRDGIFGYAKTQPVINDREDEKSKSA